MNIRFPAVAVLLALAMHTSAAAADPTGLWLTQDGEARIRVASCGSAMCGTIVWLKNPIDPETGGPFRDKHNPDAARRARPLIGVRILLSLRPTSDKWEGNIYNADDGKTYGGSIAVIDAA